MSVIKELEHLPAPGVIEEISFEAIFRAIKADFQGRYPDYSATLESDPAMKLLEVAAYREMLLRNRINEAARSALLAFSTGADLDHLAAFYGVTRLAGEGDDSLRRRTRQRIMGFSNAGGADLYRYWTLTASLDVADVAVDSPRPGHVRISVLSRDNGGQASEELLASVRSVVLRDDIRVLTDTVEVVGATILPVTVSARIWLYPDTDQRVLDVLPARFEGSFAAAAGLGWDCTRSWIVSRLHAAGVQRVELLTPAGDVTLAPNQSARLTGIELEFAGRAR